MGGPPSDTPNRLARVEPAASSTARTSSMRASSPGSALTGTRSDSPVPRLSNRISRENEASRRRKSAAAGTSQVVSTFETKPGTITRSRGPSPIT
jgi:hypothetical protein